MAEWRKHYKSMWSDSAFCGLSRDARLLWNGIIDQADDDGYLKADAISIKIQIFPADTDISELDAERLLAEIEASGMLSRRLCADNGRPVVVGWLPRWQRYQSIRGDRKRESNLLQLYALGQNVNQVATNGQPSGNQRRPRHDMKEHDKIEETDKRPAASPRLLEKSPKEEKPQNLLPSQFNYEGFLIGILRAAWMRRFDRVQHPNLKLFLRRCRTRDISPLTVMDYTKTHSPDDPLKYMQSLMRQGDGMWPENGDETYVKWEESAINNRRGATASGKGNPRENSGTSWVGDLV